MALWSLRSTPYRLGVLLLFVGSKLYLVGFAAPFWTSTEYVSSGLWQMCYSGGDHGLTCRSISITNQHIPDWYRAMQAMEGVGLVCLLIACLYALVVNCCQITVSYSRFLEILTGLGGVCGFVGCMIFVGESHEQTDSPEKYYGWAFGLNLTGSILVTGVAGVIFVANRPDLHPPPPPSTAAPAPGPFLHVQHVPLQGGYPPAGLQGSVPQEGYDAPTPRVYSHGIPAGHYLVPPAPQQQQQQQPAMQ